MSAIKLPVVAFPGELFWSVRDANGVEFVRQQPALTACLILCVLCGCSSRMHDGLRHYRKEQQVHIQSYPDWLRALTRTNQAKEHPVTNAYWFTNVHDLLQPSGKEKLQSVTAVRREIITTYKAVSVTNDVIGQPEWRSLELVVKKEEEWREKPLMRFRVRELLPDATEVQLSGTNWVSVYPKTPGRNGQAVGTTRTNYPSTNSNAKGHGKSGKVESRVYVQPTRRP